MRPNVWSDLGISIVKIEFVTLGLISRINKISIPQSNQKQFHIQSRAYSRKKVIQIIKRMDHQSKVKSWKLIERRMVKEKCELLFNKCVMFAHNKQIQIWAISNFNIEFVFRSC